MKKQGNQINLNEISKRANFTMADKFKFLINEHTLQYQTITDEMVEGVILFNFGQRVSHHTRDHTDMY